MITIFPWPSSGNLGNEYDTKTTPNGLAIHSLFIDLLGTIVSILNDPSYRSTQKNGAEYEGSIR